MRTAILSFNITFFFLLCICYLHSEVAASEICPIENCISSEKCESVIRNKSVICANQEDVCCSIVKSEFRTHCRHHGGECMRRCASQLQRDSMDCRDGQVCCVLV